MANLLERVSRARGSLRDLSEMDLAVDIQTEVTDQNHVNGWRSARDLARRAGVSRTTRVVDLGCGLGGSARVLAHLFGCRVRGIDLSPNRCREARKLTRMVGLDRLVTVECADVMRVRSPRSSCDVLWGQAAWSHLADKRRFLRKWSPTLRTGGRVAMEDACIEAPARTLAERKALDALVERWRSCLLSARGWAEILEQEGLQVQVLEDRTRAMIAYYERLIEVAPHKITPRAELASWKQAVKLAGSGAISYRRIMATMTGQRRR
jgi:trans-aconitate methyltransferase